MTEHPEPTEDPGAGADQAPAAEDGRRYPSTIGGVFYLVVLAVTLVGIGLVGAGDWRLGTRWVGAGLLFGALVRLVLPARDAGMLAVRHRAFDCVLLAVFGVLMIVLAGTIPNQFV